MDDRTESRLVYEAALPTLIGLLCALLVLGGCATQGDASGARSKSTSASRSATGNDDLGGIATRTLSTVGEAVGSAADRLRRLMSDPAVQKSFHDIGEQGEAAVLAVLRRAGLGGAARKPGRASPATAASAAGAAGTRRPAAPWALPDGEADGPLAADSLRWPVEAGVISSEYGHRWGRQHRGIDIAGVIGEPILAAADGEVIHAGTLGGYGRVVIVRHADAVTTLYAHNSALRVQPGARVRQGQTIALLGNTGRSTGPHLHFEVRRGEAAQDPRAMLPPTRLASAFAPRIAAGPRPDGA